MGRGKLVGKVLPVADKSNDGEKFFYFTLKGGFYLKSGKSGENGKSGKSGESGTEGQGEFG
jgi:hypothetical protein